MSYPDLHVKHVILLLMVNALTLIKTVLIVIPNFNVKNVLKILHFLMVIVINVRTIVLIVNIIKQDSIVKVVFLDIFIIQP